LPHPSTQAVMAQQRAERCRRLLHVMTPRCRDPDDYTLRTAVGDSAGSAGSTPPPQPYEVRQRGGQYTSLRYGMLRARADQFGPRGAVPEPGPSQDPAPSLVEDACALATLPPWFCRSLPLGHRPGNARRHRCRPQALPAGPLRGGAGAVTVQPTTSGLPYGRTLPSAARPNVTAVGIRQEASATLDPVPKEASCGGFERL
jgi:hypothetical protein